MKIKQYLKNTLVHNNKFGFINSTVFSVLAIILFIALPFIFFLHRGDSPDIYLECITTGVTLLFGFMAYKFQEETNEFNRLTKIPGLNVNQQELVHNKIIVIENTSNTFAQNVYIASFLFTHDTTEKQILYDEVQPQILTSYPVRQADILKSDFRSKFEVTDKNEYGKTLRERMSSFLSKNSSRPIYLVIALRSDFMKENETLLFFYECTNPQDSIENLKFTSRHFSLKEHLHKKALEETSKNYKKYFKKMKIKTKNKLLKKS